MIVLNTIINILNILVFSFIYNRIKNEKGIKNYLIFLLSYLVSGILTQFLYNNIIFAYLLCSIMFCLFQNSKLESFLIMINIILFLSIITAIPMVFIGYNNIYILANQIIVLSIFILSYKFPLNKLYNYIIPNWNRNRNNKIKSVTLRNIILIGIYLMITLVNIFLNQYFLQVYEKLI